MKKIIMFVVAIFVVAIAAAILFPKPKQMPTLDNVFKIPNQATMQITSPAFENNQFIPTKYSCDGANINPMLTISGVPAEAKSLVLIVDDPDAPRGTFTHWTVWNIAPTIAEIPENSVPAGAVEGVTSVNKPGWVSPCPPSGTHRYIFTLYALNTMLADLLPNTTAPELREIIKDKILAEAQLIGLYKR